MAEMIGMNVEQIRQMATKIKSEKEQLQQRMTTIDGMIKTVDTIWKGQDSKQFKELWDTQYHPALKKLIEELTQFAEKASRNATDQESTSSKLS